MPNAPDDARDDAPGNDEDARRRVRLDYIQGLRGIAVALVVAYHITTWAGIEGKPRQLSVLGAMGVDLFFVISGFCMTWPLLTRGDVGRLDARPFLTRRWLRIAPPYFLAVAGVLVASLAMYAYGGPSYWAEPMQSSFGPAAPNLWGNILSHATFTHGFFQAYVTSIDGAFWSLATEWQFYLLLPFLIPVARRFGLPAAAVIAGAVSVVHVAYVHYFAYGFPTTPLGDHIITFRLVQFAGGMFAAWQVSTQRTSRLWNMALIPALVLVSVTQQVAPRAIWPFVSAVCFGVLLMAGALRSSRTAKVLTHPVLMWLGSRSYSLYLIHGAVFMAVAVPLTWAVPAFWVRLAIYVFLAVPASLAVSEMLYRKVEVPAVKWSHAHSSGRRRVVLSR